MALDQPEDEKLQDVEMGFLDHLEELRKRLFWSATFILTGGIALFISKTGSSKRCSLVPEGQIS